MADEADRAGDLAERQRQDLLDRHRRQRRREALAEAGPRDCDGCGAAIPAERRRAAPWARRCVACQARAEREGR